MKLNAPLTLSGRLAMAEMELLVVLFASLFNSLLRTIDIFARGRVQLATAAQAQKMASQ